MSPVTAVKSFYFTIFLSAMPQLPEKSTQINFSGTDVSHNLRPPDRDFCHKLLNNDRRYAPVTFPALLAFRLKTWVP